MLYIKTQFARSLCSKMPRPAAGLGEALAKKGGLTLQRLATYDDVITDALVDRVSVLMACDCRSLADFQRCISGRRYESYGLDITRREA